MAEITKNEAIVLRKTKFSDSSLIVQLYTKEKGKISALLKGARSSKSRIGSKIDLINHVEVIFYNKEHKELQLVTQVNLIDHYSHIKEDLDKIKYASAVCELILKLIPDHEVNEKLFRGSVRILHLIDIPNRDEILHFAQYLLFFIKEIGFEITFDRCSSCGNNLDKSDTNAFSYSNGIVCNNCKEDKLLTYQFSEELFNLFKCLSTKNNINSYNRNDVENIIFILEKFLIYHNSDFKGIKSLQIL
jgi:DNA repair protein RecO (recombination protein O)